MNKTSQAAAHLGRMGGKKSVEKRLGGKTDKEISDLMRRVKLSPEQNKSLDKMVQESVDNLNKNVD